MFVPEDVRTLTPLDEPSLPGSGVRLQIPAETTLGPGPLAPCTTVWKLPFSRRGCRRGLCFCGWEPLSRICGSLASAETAFRQIVRAGDYGGPSSASRTTRTRRRLPPGRRPPPGGHTSPRPSSARAAHLPARRRHRQRSAISTKACAAVASCMRAATAVRADRLPILKRSDARESRGRCRACGAKPRAAILRFQRGEEQRLPAVDGRRCRCIESDRFPSAVQQRGEPAPGPAVAAATLQGFSPGVVACNRKPTGRLRNVPRRDVLRGTTGNGMSGFAAATGVEDRLRRSGQKRSAGRRGGTRLPEEAAETIGVVGPTLLERLGDCSQRASRLELREGRLDLFRRLLRGCGRLQGA